jgi:hypothetical protein
MLKRQLFFQSGFLFPIQYFFTPKALSTSSDSNRRPRAHTAEVGRGSKGARI